MEERTGSISHDEARQISTRFVNGHFDNPGEHPRMTIPCDPRRDDDIRLDAYIDQNAERDAAQAARIAVLEKIVNDCMAVMPFGNIRTHTPENLAPRIADLATECAEQSNARDRADDRVAVLEKALRELELWLRTNAGISVLRICTAALATADGEGK